jgi:hypothetical protein
MTKRLRFSYNDVNLSWERKLELDYEYKDLSTIHANHAKELMASIEFDPRCIPTITDPALTEALIHAQLSTTYAILNDTHNGK